MNIFCLFLLCTFMLFPSQYGEAVAKAVNAFNKIRESKT